MWLQRKQGPNEALRRWEESSGQGVVANGNSAPPAPPSAGSGHGGPQPPPPASKRLYVGGLPRMGGMETDASVRALFAGFEV